MQPDLQTPSIGTAAVTETRNRVLRNTYALLGLSLMVAAATAWVAVAFALPYPGLFIALAGWFGLLYLIHKFENEDFAVLLVFVFTGFAGYTIGPMVGYMLAKDPSIVSSALAMTALTFVGLSGYVITTKQNFGFLGGFLFAGILAAFIATLTAVIFDYSAVYVALSYAWVVLMVGLILWQTSEIVNGGETNYVRATVTLFVSIYNLFSSLMVIMGMGGDD